MMMLIDSTMAVRLRSSSPIAYCRAIRCSDDFGANVAVPWNKIRRFRKNFDYSVYRRNGSVKNGIQASGKYLGSGSDKVGDNGKSRYHPFEDILDSEATAAGEGRLTAAETSRTIVELCCQVNNQATLLFSGFIDDEVHDNVFWPDLPYLTDEHGNIYFQVNNDEDILRTLTSDDCHVQVIIGLDTREVLSELALEGPAEIDFGIEEIEDEDGEFDEEEEEEEEEDDDDDEEDDDDLDDLDWADIVDIEEDESDSEESLGDWAKLETMRSAHPMYFAKKIAEVTSDDPIDFMERPPVGLAIQGLLRPAFIEERFVMQIRRPNHPDRNPDLSKAEKAAEDNVEDVLINGNAPGSSSSEDKSSRTEDLDKGNGLANGTSFYKLEMIKIQLLSIHGHQNDVEIEDYRKARPDAIAHSAAKIISRVNAAGEKTTNALKSLCWRCKGLQVEEAALIGIDSFGFDLRVCSGTQVQTLRFTFNTRANSEYSAERQLTDLLFPRSHQKAQKVKPARRKES